VPSFGAGAPRPPPFPFPRFQNTHHPPFPPAPLTVPPLLSSLSSGRLARKATPALMRGGRLVSHALPPVRAAGVSTAATPASSAAPLLRPLAVAAALRGAGLAPASGLVAGLRRVGPAK